MEIELPATIQCGVSEGFANWLSECGGSLAISTYQAGKLALVSWDGRQISLLLRDFDKPLGLAGHGPRLALATRHDVTVFADAPILARDYLENAPGRYDALFLPRVTYHTGDLNVHDLAFGKDGLWLVNTRFPAWRDSVTITVSSRAGNRPSSRIWLPKTVAT